MSAQSSAIARLTEEHGPPDEVLEIHDQISTVPSGVYGFRVGERSWVIDVFGRAYAGASFAATLLQQRTSEWQCRVCGRVNPPGTVECEVEHPASCYEIPLRSAEQA